MSAVAEMKKAEPAQVVYNETLLYGKITHLESFKGKESKETFFKHLVRLPSSGEEFDVPGTVELVTREKLGTVNDVIKGLRCRVSGFYRTFDVTDADGVISKARTADVRLVPID